MNEFGHKPEVDIPLVLPETADHPLTDSLISWRIWALCSIAVNATAAITYLVDNHQPVYLVGGVLSTGAFAIMSGILGLSPTTRAK